MFNNLRTAIIEEYRKDKEERTNNIKKSEETCERYSTEAKINAYREGKISKEKFIDIATKRGLKEIESWEKEKIDLLSVVEKSGILIDATITVEWKRSATWGNNPKAEIQYRYKDENGNIHSSFISGNSIGGCGYDKESTAIAEVLNVCYEALKPLYVKKNEQPEKGNHDLLGYGSGYYTLPRFEGGVGTNCFRSIFENLGYKWETVSSGKTFDVYKITLNQ